MSQWFRSESVLNAQRLSVWGDRGSARGSVRFFTLVHEVQDHLCCFMAHAQTTQPADTLQPESTHAQMKTGSCVLSFIISLVHQYGK